MPADPSLVEPGVGTGELVLGVDTCGPTGSVALGRILGDSIRVLGQTELAGRSYSATLIAAVADLMGKHGVRLQELHALVVTRGPGSFTGVRVGLSAVKGLAEPAGIPLVAVSRLEVLAWKARVLSSALDAHRHEVFLRLEEREMLAGLDELKAVSVPGPIAVCDEGAAALLAAACPAVALRTEVPPTAADALRHAAKKIVAREFVDLALLDGHYLRKSDAEIFGESAESKGETCSRR